MVAGGAPPPHLHNTHLYNLLLLKQSPRLARVGSFTVNLFDNPDLQPGQAGPEVIIIKYSDLVQCSERCDANQRDGKISTEQCP